MFGRMPKRRKVRIHLHEDPNLEITPSIDGYLLGRRYGHYILEKPALVKGEQQTVELESRTVEIAESKVWFYEVFS